MEPDTECAHAQADVVLVALVRKYVERGDEIAELYHHVGKWYA